jgi:hypothetical protein
MSAAMVSLATITLGSAQSTITFGSIPTSGYRDLQVVVSFAMSGTGSASRLRFNGDTGANYNGVWMGGQGSAAASGSESGATGSRIIGYSVGPTTGQQTFTMSVMDYSATDKHKTAISRFSDAGGDVQATATRWASTSAITSLTIYDVLGQNFTAGSVFSLYGVVS